MRTDAAHHTLLPKWLALPVFCSDPLSSVAYATEQILMVLVLGGLSALHFAPMVGAAVAILIAIVVASYTRTIHAYPNGGGAYAVAKDQFGDRIALIAASALIIDYILTVAVSITSGVANFISAFPVLAADSVPLSLGTIVIITMVNLRGIKESGRAFAVPTYAFIGSVLTMIVMGIYRHFTGAVVQAPTAHLQVHAQSLSQLAMAFLILRAFASGCTALTGVEAISNGVPFFREPKPRNASRTLIGMGVLAVTMFVGVTWLAITSGAKIADNPIDLGLPAGSTQQTVIAQIGTAVFGSGSFGFFFLQMSTTFVLILAANTSYNSFPIMASVLGRDGFLPRQFGRRGDRLVYSNGVIILAVVSALLVWLYKANVTHLVQLYILGVFLSFTISQAGMVKRWMKIIRESAEHQSSSTYISLVTNSLGAVITAIVLVIVVITKFQHGAWIVVIGIPTLVFVMNGIKQHYANSDMRLRAQPQGVELPGRVHAVVLVSRANAPSLQALAYAAATKPSTLVAAHAVTYPDRAEKLRNDWSERAVPVDLVLLESPYRDVTSPVLKFISELRADNPGDLITVFIPEYVVIHWWENLLHNQSALRLKRRLLYEPNVLVTNVPLIGTRYEQEIYEASRRVKN